MQIFSGTPGIRHQSPLLQIHWQLCRFAPFRPPAVHNLLIAAPGRRIAAAEVAASRPAAPHPDGKMGKKVCWIHKKYGVDATSCRPGCEWAEN